MTAPNVVSVVIPTLNRPAELENAVASVIAQDVDCEVIVVDDGSQPPVAPIGALADPSVKIIRNDTRSGPTHARSRGLAAASGSFIAFLDDDDVWLPKKLRRSLEVAQEYPGARVVVHRTGFDERMATGNRGSVRVETQPLRLYGRNATPHLDSVLVEADLARRVGFDEDFYACQDVDFVLGLARHTPFAVLDEVLALRGRDTPPSAIGLESRITGRHLLIVKHPDVFDSDSEARAFHYVRLAHLHLRGGRRIAASKGFARALRHRPFYTPAWRGIVITMLPSSLGKNLSLYRRMRAEDRLEIG